MTDLTFDKFLGGLLTLAQPKFGYRAGIDPVLLAAACTAEAGQSVLDIGCGVGTAALCLGARVAQLDLAGIEVQQDYFDLAKQNAAKNNLPFLVKLGDVTVKPDPFADRRFDHVLLNPPYFTDGSLASDAGRAAGRSDGPALSKWLGYAARRLKPKGTLTLIQAIPRMPEVMAALPKSLGSITLQPMAPRTGRAPKLFLLQARKGGRGDFVMKPVMILHDGEIHIKDGEDYSPQISAVLRHGAPLKVFS